MSIVEIYSSLHNHMMICRINITLAVLLLIPSCEVNIPYRFSSLVIAWFAITLFELLISCRYRVNNKIILNSLVLLWTFDVLVSSVIIYKISIYYNINLNIIFAALLVVLVTIIKYKRGNGGAYQ